MAICRAVTNVAEHELVDAEEAEEDGAEEGGEVIVAAVPDAWHPCSDERTRPIGEVGPVAAPVLEGRRRRGGGGADAGNRIGEGKMKLDGPLAIPAYNFNWCHPHHLQNRYPRRAARGGGGRGLTGRRAKALDAVHDRAADPDPSNLVVSQPVRRKVALVF